MKSALFLPLFEELAAPRAVADLTAEAEAYGWDGVFVWDHVRWREPIRAVSDPWVTLAAMAMVTSRIRLGPMVTPLPRRRPIKVARETATLDQLSNGRLTLGVGIGSDRFGEEWSRTGEEQDERIRGRMLDAALDVLAGAWSGEPVHHRGESYVVDEIAFEPRPVQRPGVPVWVAGFPGRKAPLRRAARHDGFVPVNLSEPAQVEEIVAEIAELRGGAATAFDIAVALPAETDPLPYAAAGATWRLVEIEPGATLDTARGILRSVR